MLYVKGGFFYSSFFWCITYLIRYHWNSWSHGFKVFPCIFFFLNIKKYSVLFPKWAFSLWRVFSKDSCHQFFPSLDVYAVPHSDRWALPAAGVCAGLVTSSGWRNAADVSGPSLYDDWHLPLSPWMPALVGNIRPPWACHAVRKPTLGHTEDSGSAAPAVPAAPAEETAMRVKKPSWARSPPNPTWSRKATWLSLSRPQNHEK